MFVEFFKAFETEEGFKYRKLISSMALDSRTSLVIDWQDLLSYNEELANRLIDNPKEVLEAASQAIKDVMRIENPEFYEKVDRFHARVRGLPETLHVSIRGIRAAHIGKLIAVEGVVTKISPVKQQLVEAVFRCRNCGTEITVPQNEQSFVKPSTCTRCEEEGRKRSDFEFIPEKSKFLDWQRFVLQEKPEELPPGQLPRSIDVILKEDLVDTIRPGDRVTVIGFISISRERSRNEGPPLFRPYLEANYVEVSSKENMDLEITSEDVEKILKLSHRKDIRELIVSTIAPSIYGYEKIKKAIAALLFGGVPKVYPDGVRVRGDIHILLVGDPGTAKSQLLRYVASLAPRGIYTTGKGSTAAGLTAAVVREKSTGDFFLEAGALVLADGGVACIDEFDKMDPKDRVSIHEAMEQQTVSIAKAGIVATLNARTSVLAAANPAFGRYMLNRSVSENIDLPVTILSRFDLIFVMTDKPDKERDEELAEHVLDFHSGRYPEHLESIIPAELLKKYIAYARRYIKPKLSEEARKKLMDFYIEMRRKGEGEGSPIAITPRQLEALIRLAEAHAKMALSEVVTVEDAEAAIDLMNYFLHEVGIDIETRRLDIDVVMTGQSMSQREKIMILMDLIKRMIEENEGDPVKREDVVARATEMGFDELFVRKVIEKLQETGELMEPRPGYILRTVP
ncbi:MAG: Minichromosome maintenance protein MCM [Thermoprotei archaeon]|nr:MAG: Minichromosome maintenance protein MCM [Thermoprotei archaeon]